MRGTSRDRTPRSGIGIRLARHLVLGAFVLGALGLARASKAADQTSEALALFEAEVRPVLVERCQRCHGPDRQRGGLRLDSLEAMLKGGDFGPAVEPGDPEASLIVEAVRHDGLAMPPDGKLDDDQVAAIVDWVTLGAPWPGTDAQAAQRALELASAEGPFTPEDHAWWSLQPVQRPEPPVVSAGAIDQLSELSPESEAIDRFVLRRLNEAGLEPAPQADRRTLVRRLTFDLLGLPPTPTEIDRFIQDERPDAWARLVDELLERPEYGERMARRWLDLVRYAESDGYRQDAYRPNAWRYRDYVVQAFQDDTPYDRFVQEQLAGDELRPDDPEVRIATGYLRLGIFEYNNRDIDTQDADILNDITDVTADVFLGLGFGCARCHDHKFDPILQADYYRLQAFFAPLIACDAPTLSDGELQDHRQRVETYRAQTDGILDELDAIRDRGFALVWPREVARYPLEIQEYLNRDPSERTPLEQRRAALAERQIRTFQERDWLKVLPKEDKKRQESLQEALAELEQAHCLERPEELPVCLTIAETSEPPPMTIPNHRSDSALEPGFLTILDPEPATIPEPDPESTTSGRRLALARWITDPEHPLTARVMVNRIWQQHFGRGLVASPNDFGRLGGAPTHPELLDWLAETFVGSGWSVKAMHRAILLTSTYRQASRPADPSTTLQVDPTNLWLSHMPMRRLEAEQVRDAVLVVSGEMSDRRGGPSRRADRDPVRTIYTEVRRNAIAEVLAVFDGTAGSGSVPVRNVTTTPTQALLMLNGDWLRARGTAFADRVRLDGLERPDRAVARAWRLALGRPPEPFELEAALEFLGDDPNRLDDLCHALLNANEFLYID